MVTDDMNQSLLMPISKEEIRVAARQMGGLKAPGSDGFQGVFYHSFWDYIVKEVNELVMFLSNGEACLRQLNATHIVLIPKVQNPESVSHFRPVSLCNFSYKVLSMVLTNKLKPLLPTIIPCRKHSLGVCRFRTILGLHTNYSTS